MAQVVGAVGLLIVLIGVFGFFFPSALLDLVERVGANSVGFALSIVIRATLGVLFIVAASSTRLPELIGAVGVLSLAAALGIAVIGHSRMRRFMQWWTTWPMWLVRLTLTLVVGFGALLVYAAA